MIELLIIIDFYENLICQLPEFLDEIYKMGAEEMKNLCVQKCKVPSTQFFEEKVINDKTFYIMSITTEDNVIVSSLVEPLVEKKEVWKLLQEFGSKVDTSSGENVTISTENQEQIQQQIQQFNDDQNKRLQKKKQTRGNTSEFLDSDVEEIYDNKRKSKMKQKNLKFWMSFVMLIIGSIILLGLGVVLFKYNLDSKIKQLIE